jgi:ABC-type branched-subunit amino acid transport system substrate-binding protein
MLGISINGGTFYQAMGSKPILGGVPVGPADFNSKNADFYYGGAPAAQNGLATFAKSKSPKKVTYFYDDVAAGQSQAKGFAAAFAGTSIALTQVGINPSASDVLPFVTKGGVTSADLIVVSLAGCVPVADALKTLGAKGQVVTGSSCLTTQNLQSRPDLFEGWYVVTFAKLVNTKPGVDSETDTFNTKYKQYASASTSAPGAFAEKGWGLVLTMRTVLAGMEYKSISSSDSVAKALAAYTGPVVMGTKVIKCPGADPYPAVCSQTPVSYQVKSGTPVPVS